MGLFQALDFLMLPFSSVGRRDLVAEHRHVLTTEQRRRVADWVNSKAPNLRCPVCAATHFSVAEHFLSPTVVTTAGNVMIGAGTYPQVMIVCRDCGHMLMFSAVIIGLMDEKEDSKDLENANGR